MKFLDLLDKQETEVKKFNAGDKIGYALGDMGNAMFFGFVGSYLMVFYTDVLGISAAAVGTLFLVARIWDAINDPIMGTLVDKVGTTKHGKFRPYIVLFGLPLTLVGILTFTAFPGMAEGLKLPYAYITYILFGMLYTAVNIPYGSMAAVMTTDPIERTALSTFRTIGSLLANVIVMVLAPMLILNSNGGVSAGGFVKSAIIFAVITNICYVFTFRLTRERVIHKENKDAKKASTLGNLKLLLKNRAFIGISLASFTLMAGMLIGNTLNVYLFKDYFKSPTLVSLASVLSMGAAFLVMPFVGKLVAKFGKKEIAVAGMAITTVAYGIFFILPISNPYIYLIILLVAGVGSGFFNVVIWALVSDAIDYQEYLTGSRNEGTMYSTYSLFRKLSQAISGGIGGFALGWLGYQSGASVQTAAVGQGIKHLVAGANFLAAGLTFVILLFVFNLTKSKLETINAELEEKRKIS